VDGADSGSDSHVFTFGTEVDTSWYFLFVELLEKGYWFGFLYEIPFVDVAILARDDKGVGRWLDGGADDGGNNGLEKNCAFFALFVDFLELRCL
jgi:hypothetical protein